MLRGGCSAICKNKTIIWVIVNNIWQFEKDLLKNQPSVHYYLILCMIIITYIAYGKKRNAEAELSQFNHSIVSSCSSFWKDCDDSTPHKPLLQPNVDALCTIFIILLTLWNSEWKKWLSIFFSSDFDETWSNCSAHG